MSPETRVKLPEKRSHVARILSGEVRKEEKLIFLNKECVLIYHSLNHNEHNETKQAVRDARILLSMIKFCAT